MAQLIESGKFFTQTLIKKYNAEDGETLKNLLGREPTAEDFEYHNVTPEETVVGPQPGNVLTTVGVNLLWRRCSLTTPQWTSTSGAIGVGDSTTAGAAGNTDLAGTNKWYQVWSSSPSASTNSLAFVSTFPANQANFAWNEYAVIIPDTSASAFTSAATKQANYVILNRKGGSGLLGTKTAAQIWTFTATVSLT